MTDPSFLHHRRSIALALLLGLGLIPAARAQIMTDPNLTVDTIVPSGAGLSQPTTMSFLGPNDFLVLEKATGRVRRVMGNPPVLQPGFVLDVNVNSSSERGMLGIAIAQGSPIHVFLYYTEAQGSDGGTPLGNRVYRYDWDPAGPGALINPQLILDLPVLPGPNHDSGVILIDPSSGLLYAQIGDLNHSGQLQNQPGGAPPDDTGVILRVNQDGTPAAGNPFTPYCSVTTTQTCQTSANCPGAETCITQVARYYAYGIRNGFGLEFDRANGQLWMSENGPNDFDELNKVNAGMNGGWNQIRGPGFPAVQWNVPGAGNTYSQPEFSWQQVVVPTGVNFPFAMSWGPSYNNQILVTTQSGNIYSFPLNAARDALDVSMLPPALQDLVANTTTEANLVRIGQGFGAATDLEIGPDLHLYVVDINGRVLRVRGQFPVSLQDFRVE
jgi:glucose/arabinose dehydrogenase